ncbi:MAG: hypothetical protein K0U68_08395 [Gammaproteobacteria bacterium]|nr:hypothetical protein [Gammaproteobacteria bacterium]
MNWNHYSKGIPTKLRSQLAQEAARLIIEEGITGYQPAKLKAANRFGVTESDAMLPGNEEIDRAILEYHRIFSSKQCNWLHQKRTAAIKAMEFFQDFSPRLTGPLISGVAGQFSPVMVYLHTDSPEQIIIRLLDADIPFREKSHDVMSVKGDLEIFSRLRVGIDSMTVDLYLFPIEYLRNKPKTNYLLTKQATIRQVKKLLNAHHNQTSTTRDIQIFCQ